MSVKEVIAEYKAEIDKELKEFLGKERENAKSISPSLFDMAEHVEEFNLRGGKRLRPVLLIHGFKCFQKENKEILKASLSIELLEAYLLMHDDIMDDDALRRGKPSTWKTFETIHKQKKWSGSARKFGETTAIIAGDICCSLATEAIAKTNFPAELKIKAIQALNRINVNTGYGQALDVISEVKEGINESDIMLVHKLKTSKYTVEGPLHIGAILGGASEKDLQVLSNYGIPVGQAFQIQDDILGMFGDEEKLGKPADSDLKEGKKTLLILEALKNGSKEQKEKIIMALGNKNASKEMVEQVRQVIKETGSLDYSKKLAKKLAKKGKKVMQESNFKNEGKEFLIGMADFLINREY